MAARDQLRPDELLWDWLAFELRIHREDHGQTLTQVGDLLGITKGQVSNCEAGRRKLTTKQAEILDTLWHTRGRLARLLKYAREGHDPDWFQTFTEFEGRASMIHNYSGQLIPALLQTPRYARALLMAGRPKNPDATVEARMARQEILYREDPPEFWALLSESVIDLPIGGPEVMREQLAHLLELSELPNVVLRMVPRSAGAHEGLDGPFKVITVREGQVGFIEAPNGGRLVLDASEAGGLRVRFDRIGSVALPVGSSRSLIRQHMEAMK